ncbi:MAG: hypothetical protein ACPGVO_13385 [Spirulinaceae cyanobacterium]
MKQIVFNLMPLLMALPSLAIAPPDAQAQPDPSQSCPAAIAAAFHDIDAVAQVQIIRIHVADHDYTDAPEGRSEFYNIWIEGNGAETVMNSPVFLTDLATDIIDACPTLGFFEVGVYRTDWNRIFGIGHDGQVAEFECLELTGEPLEPDWGAHVCL